MKLKRAKESLEIMDLNFVVFMRKFELIINILNELFLRLSEKN